MVLFVKLHIDHKQKELSVVITDSNGDTKSEGNTLLDIIVPLSTRATKVSDIDDYDGEDYFEEKPGNTSYTTGADFAYELNAAAASITSESTDKEQMDFQYGSEMHDLDHYTGDDFYNGWDIDESSCVTASASNVEVQPTTKVCHCSTVPIKTLFEAGTAAGGAFEAWLADTKAHNVPVQHAQSWRQKYKQFLEFLWFFEPEQDVVKSTDLPK